MLELGLGLTQYIPVVLYVVTIAVLILTIVYRAEIGIIYFVFFLPLQNLLLWAEPFPMGKDLNDLLLIAVMVGWFVKGRKSHLPKIPFKIPIAIIVLWTLFSLWNGTNYIGKASMLSMDNPLLIEWKNYLIPFVFYFLVLFNIREKRQMILVVGAMFMVMLLLDRNVYNVLHFRDLSHYDAGSFYNSGKDALNGNYLAAFLAQYICLFVALFFCDDSKWRKFGYFVIIAGSYYCILFLFSRGAYFASVVSLLLIGFLYERKILALLFVVLLFWNIFVPNAVRERIEMTKDVEDGYDATTLERIYIWEKAKDMISQKPLDGSGFRITTQISISLEDDRFKAYSWKSFHNNYLQTIVEQGIIGLLIVLWLYGLSFWYGFKLFRLTRDGFYKGLGLGLMASTVAILASNFTGTTWHLFNIAGFYWVLVALVMRSLANISRDQILSKKVNEDQGKREFRLRNKGKILVPIENPASFSLN